MGGCLEDAEAVDGELLLCFAVFGRAEGEVKPDGDERLLKGDEEGRQANREVSEGGGFGAFEDVRACQDVEDDL